MTDGPARPWWKNVFVIAFAAGVVVLTVLPVLQRRFLKAPPPLGPVPPWELVTLAGTPVGPAVQGKVVLMTFAPPPCEAACVERQRGFATAVHHTDDLGDAVHVVTVAPEVSPGVAALDGGARWHVVTGSPGTIDGLAASVRAAWGTFAGTDAGTTTAELVQLPAVALVDQDRQLRGFWRDDPAGRGNAINAARLLAEYGPTPGRR